MWRLVSVAVLICQFAISFFPFFCHEISDVHLLLQKTWKTRLLTVVSKTEETNNICRGKRVARLTVAKLHSMESVQKLWSSILKLFELYYVLLFACWTHWCVFDFVFHLFLFVNLAVFETYSFHLFWMLQCWYTETNLRVNHCLSLNVNV